MRFCLLLFSALLLIACNKPNPHPELADEIYLDLNSKVQETQKELEAAKKNFEEQKKELAAVVPQTGTIKYAQKRYFEAERKIQALEQEKKYLELKTASRKKYTQIEYQKAFKAGKPWPTVEEVEAYRKYKEVSTVPPSWNSKNRVDTYEKAHGLKEIGPNPKESGPKEAE